MKRINSDATSIDAYVSKLVSPLERTLDAPSLSEFRNNSIFHLECLVDEYRNEGRSEHEAVAFAIADFGPADRSALAMLDEWCRGRKPSAFSRTSSSAVWWSFAWFGLAAGCSLILIQLAMMWPTEYPLEPIAVATCLIAPLFAGIGVGCCVPTGNLRAMGLAFLPLAAHALIAALLMGPFNGGATYLTLFVCAWAPLGAVALTLTSWFRRNRPAYRPTFPPKEVSQ